MVSGRFPEEAPKLFVPAPVVPVAPQIGGLVRHHDEMEGPGWDRCVAAGTYVVLAGGVGLDRGDRYPRIAHASSARMITMVPMTRATSRGDLRAGRNGLNPIDRDPSADKPGPHELGYRAAQHGTR